MRQTETAVGIFNRRNQNSANSKAEVVKDVGELYEVGVIAQIYEFQDLGDKLRLVVKALRRICLKEKLNPEELDLSKVKGKGGTEDAPNEGSGKVLMVRVENVETEKYDETSELKALKKEIEKSVREYCAENPFYK